MKLHKREKRSAELDAPTVDISSLIDVFDIADNVEHQRFIDVLNCLTEMEVDQVTFVDHTKG